MSSPADPGVGADSDIRAALVPEDWSCLPLATPQGTGRVLPEPFPGGVARVVVMPGGLGIDTSPYPLRKATVSTGQVCADGCCEWGLLRCPGPFLEPGSPVVPQCRRGRGAEGGLPGVCCRRPHLWRCCWPGWQAPLLWSGWGDQAGEESTGLRGCPEVHPCSLHCCLRLLDTPHTRRGGVCSTSQPPLASVGTRISCPGASGQAGPAHSSASHVLSFSGPGRALSSGVSSNGR